MRAEGLGTDWLEAAGTEKGTAEAVPQAGERDCSPACARLQTVLDFEIG